MRIYDDRVEIENPGGLPDGITKRDFGKSSVRRNPIIADLFHRMGKVERMGSGIERMRELMRDAGLKEPVFEMDAFFRVTFYRDPRYSLKAGRFQKAGKKDGETGGKTRGITGEKRSEKIQREVGEKVGGRAEKIRRKYGENAEKGLEESWVKKLGEKLGERLGENENRILEIVAKNKFVTIPELSKTLGISTTAVENNLAKLKVKKILKRIGPDKGGYWEIVNG